MSENLIQPSEELPPLVELCEPGRRCRTASVKEVRGVVSPSTIGPARIRLLLESGCEVDIPMKQESIDALYRLLRSVAIRI